MPLNKAKEIDVKKFLASTNRTGSQIERFERNFEPVTESGCWIWTGGRNRMGYGKFSISSIYYLAHRVSYSLYIGPIPKGMVLDHLCRVPACINPKHLEPVTHGENLRRGNNPVGVNAKKTHCIKGHPLSGNNLLVYSGARHCKICTNQTARRKYGNNGPARTKKYGLPLGVKCVTGSRKFQAIIKHNKKDVYLGVFETPELASEAYQKAKQNLLQRPLLTPQQTRADE